MNIERFEDQHDCTHPGGCEEFAYVAVDGRDYCDAHVPDESYRRYRALLTDEGVEEGTDDDDHADEWEGERYAMVETNINGHQTWITLWNDIHDACAQNVNQEYAEEWYDPTIVDLTSGDVYGVVYTAVPKLTKAGA